ncbi:hypothetical protein C8R44DRAFT_164468 [Mycena epipterygia]|nr:hypothetical protein C8R44DRAFT_164468 [Mycena epipterygia]
MRSPPDILPPSPPFFLSVRVLICHHLDIDRRKDTPVERLLETLIGSWCSRGHLRILSAHRRPPCASYAACAPGARVCRG